MLDVKVGDVLYGKSRYDIVKTEVARLTKTLVICGNGDRLKKRDDYPLVTSGDWYKTYYYKATPELEVQYNQKILVRYLNKYEFGNLPYQTLKKIKDIIDG